MPRMSSVGAQIPPTRGVDGGPARLARLARLAVAVASFGHKLG